MKALHGGVVSLRSRVPLTSSDSLRSSPQATAIFDTSYLVIKDISLLVQGSKDTTLEYDVDARHPNLGSKLTVFMPNPLAEDDIVQIKIAYETTKACTAIGWLEPQQTGSGLYPFLYS